MLRKKITFTILIPLTLVLGSCGNSKDLKSARDLAKLGDTASTAFQKIANDQYDSCLRTARYTILQTSTTGGIDSQRKEQEQSCENYPKKAKDSLDKANGVVIGYIKALGSLAADDLTNYDPQLDSIASSLKQLKFNTNQVEAGSGIAKVLFRVATNKYRQKQLKIVVVSTDKDFQTYIQGLSKAITDNYINGALETEKLAVDNYYREYLGDVLNSNSANNAQGVTAITGLDNQWQNTKTTIIEKQKLGEAYVNALNDIAKGHQKLTDRFSTGKMLSQTELHQMTEKYVKDLNLIAEKSNKLLKTTPEK
ncbi:hypothetical protein G7B40_010735 [Aetokthonos hydrillicola Thurmond2011]|jgi:hypothetical protein|uniref:Lipoprotein n=1 Tax=Aetokthonos hydrillicola Thurmond2011 TaxID=2712845 RepID=A0AAP5MA17_9CYAN|nr:hypothetical protein [Aetokthonos hydrillicola]MBO3459858.1 hypothetical protein [Aetokthonos hydrillicola CCALA 1050]MBW4588452.1 hypothetical protein [Aetokthonos hydrillicola CCALA 1050]MDR9895039.1 hypothetical protein [Aetokthonos hydrillicola Thurmond2011]